jgi:charged multivesicular body protein 7
VGTCTGSKTVTDRTRNRLTSLYQDLNQLKTKNPEGYVANAEAWQTALTHAALAGQLPTEQLYILQTSDSLLSALNSPKNGRPSGLGAVLDDCVRQGKMIDLKDFQQAERSIYSKSWLPSPWAILRWSLQQTGLVSNGSYNVSGRLRNGSLVIIPALEEIAKKISSWQRQQGQAHTDRIISRDAFSQTLPSILGCRQAPSPTDLDVLLQYLSRDRQLLSHSDKAIKFSPLSATHPEPITTEDESIANLKQLISTFAQQIEALEAQISKQQSRAATYVSQKNKTSALNALRSKKRAEKMLEQRNATLHQLEDVYSSIEQAADQITIVETLQSSATTLKALNKRVGDVDKVDDIMEDLREQMGKTEEVGNVLQEPLKDDAIGDAEVDEELEAMEREAQEKEEKRKQDEMAKRLDEAGKVPEHVTQPAQSRKVSDNDIEAELSKSVDKLDRLELTDRTKEDRVMEQG